MTSYSLPKITSFSVHYKKPWDETFPPLLTSHCRPSWSMTRTRSCAQQRAPKDGRAVQRQFSEGPQPTQQHTGGIKFHKVGKGLTFTIGNNGDVDLCDFLQDQRKFIFISQ